MAVNALVPALLSGNAVIMKQAPQTFPVADRFQAALDEAGLPKGVFQKLDIDLDIAKLVIQHPNISGVLFTGSVNGGHAVNFLAAEAKKFIHVGLELGGNDPAYVRSDADVKNAAANLVDGACYNSGQSCCGIERIYVHETVYDEFIEECVKVAKEYVLGDPFKDETNLGPVVNLAQANTIRKQINGAIKQGAKPLIDESLFASANESSCYVAPQILVNVNHQMAIMTSETFGPVVGIQKVFFT